MQDDQARVAGKVVNIEGEHPAQTVQVHRRNKPRVMRRFAAHSILADNALPLVIKVSWILKQQKSFFNSLNNSESMLRHESKPVAWLRSSTNRPQLIQVLRHHTQQFTPVTESLNSSAGRSVIRVLAIKAAH